jgi:hypothetical protein
MKRLFILTTLLISAYFLNAQANYLIINGGLTNPVGNFADNDIDNGDAGFATIGYNLGFEAGLFFNPWVGIGGAFKFSNSGSDNDLINEHLNLKYGNILDTISFTSGKYNMQNFLIGPYGKLDITNHFSIMGKFFVGVLSLFRPDQTLTWTEYGQEEKTLYQEGNLAYAFAWNLGGGVHVRLGNRIGLAFMADYISSKPEFVEFNYDDLTTFSEKQPITFINYTFGLSFIMD